MISRVWEPAMPIETDLFLASWVEQQFGAHIKDEETKKRDCRRIA